jgi:hypothetical protein
MNTINRAKIWLFAPQRIPVPWWRVILWWELRRIPFNLLIGFYGIVCLVLFYWAITTSGQLQPGEDAEEPLALILAPFAANACYTLGWLLELPMRFFIPELSPMFSPVLLKLGIGISFFIISVPAVFWVGYRVLQFAHVLH